MYGQQRTDIVLSSLLMSSSAGCGESSRTPAAVSPWTVADAPKTPTTVFKATPFGIACSVCQRCQEFKTGNSLCNHVRQPKKRKSGIWDAHQAFDEPGFPWAVLHAQLDGDVKALQQAQDPLDEYLLQGSKHLCYACSDEHCSFHSNRHRNCLGHVERQHLQKGQTGVSVVQVPACKTIFGHSVLLESGILRHRVANHVRLETGIRTQSQESNTLLMGLQQQVGSEQDHSAPVALHLLSQSDYETVIHPFVNDPKECASQYVGILQSLVRALPTDIEQAVMAEFHLWYDSPGDHETHLTAILFAADIWMTQYARSNVQNLDGNFRSSIMMLGERSLMRDGEMSYNSTFNMRGSVSRLMTELRPILRYVWRQNQFSFDDFRQELLQSPNTDRLVRTYFVPRLLHRVLTEVPENVVSRSLISRYCQARMFKKRGEGVVIRSAGESATNLAAAGHVFRVGFCSAIWYWGVTTNLTIVDANAEAAKLHCGVLNTIMPWQRICREIQNNKPNEIHTYIVNGLDVVVNDYVFHHQQWSMLIPTMMSLACDDILPKVYEGT